MAKWSLPAMQALLQFESAARLRNFTQAADELGSSQPAISLRMAQLEKELGVPLFVRQHRGVQLTAEALQLLAAVQQGLTGIQQSLDQIAASRRPPRLTLATDFAFASYWLMPRLAELRNEMPELDLRIMTSQQAIDPDDEAVDIAIAFGEGVWPGCHAHKLLPERVLPVCSPQLLHGLHAQAGPVPWHALPLLHLERAPRLQWMDWKDWFSLQHLPAPPAGQALSFNNYPLLIQAALAGQGVALGWLPLVEDFLASGQLLALPAPPLLTGRGYYLLLRESARLTPVLNRFRNWIVDSCGAP